jgi:putative ATP-dependent endonuclease of the OLD family
VVATDVEGITDRIFFEALLKHFRPKDVFGQPYEVVSVGGKFLFKKYQQLLEASKVRWKLVADRDYARSR